MIASPIDLRSDFVARPTAAMIAFASEVATRAASFLPWEDCLVQELERLGADLLGRSAATFTINCTTANYLAMAHLSTRIDRLVLSDDSHIVRNEAGLLPSLPLKQPPLVVSDTITCAQALLKDGQSVLLAIENSELYRCGRPLCQEELGALRGLKRDAGDRLRLHLDGSRLLNAHAALGYDLVRDFDFIDSISISLNKGLAAPIGALLLGDDEMVASANARALQEGRIVRPAHIPAAYGLMALRTTLGDLEGDNRRAATVARLLSERLATSGATIEYGGTNIVFAVWQDARLASDFVERLGTANVLGRVFRDDRTVRLVFHRDVDDDAVLEIERVILAAYP